MVWEYAASSPQLPQHNLWHNPIQIFAEDLPSDWRGVQGTNSSRASPACSASCRNLQMRCAVGIESRRGWEQSPLCFWWRILVIHFKFINLAAIKCQILISHQSTRTFHESRRAERECPSLSAVWTLRLLGPDLVLAR